VGIPYRIGGAGKKVPFFTVGYKDQIWNLVFVVGGVLGGYLAVTFLDNGAPLVLAKTTISDLQKLGIPFDGELAPKAIFSWDNFLTFKGFLIMSVGGFLIGFGTRWADGCTSGHAIRGLSSLRLLSLIAVVGFFIGGLIMTFLLFPLIFSAMKFFKYLLIGVLFGVVMTKSQAISWYRIQEMFRFQSFHMYGIIGTAVLLGILMLQGMRRFDFKSIEGNSVEEKIFNPGYKRYLFGGIVFGLGWALSGACPGPLYVLVVAQFTVFLVMIGSCFWDICLWCGKRQDTSLSIAYKKR